MVCNNPFWYVQLVFFTSAFGNSYDCDQRVLKNLYANKINAS